MTGYFELTWLDGTISVSLVGVLLVVALVQRLGIARGVFIGMIRTFAQLMIIGYVLKFLFDLWQANTHCLQQNGLVPNNIHCAGLCTLCHNDWFCSYRKEGAQAGRFVAAICLACASTR